MFLVIWNMTSQSAVCFFSWKFFSRRLFFSLCIFFASQRSRGAVPSAGGPRSLPLSRCPAGCSGDLRSRSRYRSRECVGGTGGPGAGRALCPRCPPAWPSKEGVALGQTPGTQRLRNWSPRFVYPLYISQTWKLKKGEIYEENLNFPFLLNGFSLILTWFYHVPVEGLRVYTVC